ncbi:Phospholipase B1, membrane-associated [Merluccius polli]|uniref:Phospholipase B1, membrane-associated n=1 Tax=Merluccius polli TaxID=89951 RepID=A0AA47MBC6_MERPO|nr:Phospholipase B1, membrane-associated [Merluccius polli]
MVGTLLRLSVLLVAAHLAELLPDVIFSPLDLALEQRSLLEEAGNVSRSLSQHQATDWKFVLLFVPTDSLCSCTQQATMEPEAMVGNVEAALEILKEKVSLQRALERFGEREDFAVSLHLTPIIVDPTTDSESNVENLNQLALQLLENMVRVPSPGEARVKDAAAGVAPCHIEVRRRSATALGYCGYAPIYLLTQKNSPRDRTETGYSNASLTDPVMGTEMVCVERDPSPTTPTSVHALRPGDVKVVAAVGDSITAGNGVGAQTDNLLLVRNQYRGLSWSIGGDANLANVTTLPNILKEFNSNLTGFSLGVGDENSPQAFFNQAVAGAKSGNVAAQVRTLVDKMKNDMRIDFQNDWKVITLFIGGNDICDFCTDTVYFSPKNVVGRVRQALDILHKEVPRAMVNLVELMHIVPLRELHQEKSLRCPTFFVKIICPCILKPRNGSGELRKVEERNRAYQSGLRELVDSGRYDTHDNFTVVLQPFFREVFLPRLEDGRPDRSYFTPDCFHLSQKAHTLMALALWNNMVEPVGNKTFSQDFSAGIDMKCPSQETPFLRTAQNSGYVYPGPRPPPPPVTNWGSEFTCADAAPSDPAPASVHKLRPADIKVVGAMGDSITTGFGAKSKSILGLFTEYRGVSWSIGGDKTLKTVTTLPNILRMFNPHIKGVSKGQGKWQLGFNVAETGARASHFPEQARQLIDTMRNNTAVDFEKDWKLVTLFVGGNDLCQYCHDRVSSPSATYSTNNYIHHLKTSLDILYKEVPRLLLNVVEMLELKALRKMKKDALCSFLQKQGCPCFLELSDDSPELAELKRVNRDYQRETENLVYGGRYDARDDFTIVLQPFFRNTILPLTAEGKPDANYMAPDCFHFSERGHADMARAVWSNMLEPVGQKQTYNNFTSSRTIKCPAEEHPYIFTRVNSYYSPATTPGPGSTSTPGTAATPLSQDCPDGVPAWAAAVLAVAGLQIGCLLTWLLLSYLQRRSRRKMETGVCCTIPYKVLLSPRCTPP